jgi:hypothetical protein
MRSGKKLLSWNRGLITGGTSRTGFARVGGLSPGMSASVLYQGTTSVVPTEARNVKGFSPCNTGDIRREGHFGFYF